MFVSRELCVPLHGRHSLALLLIANRVRNEVVSEYADNFILFWDGKDENILKLSNICERKGKNLLIVQVIRTDITN